MYILTLMLAVLVSCCKADIPAVDKASASSVVSAADCRAPSAVSIRQEKDCIKVFKDRETLRLLGSVLDIKHSSSEIWKSREDFHFEPAFRFDDRKIVYKLHVFNDSTLVCGMNFEAFFRDSLMVSRDNGNTWNATALPGIFRGDNSLAYSGNNVYVAFLNEYDGLKSGLCVKDIITGSARIFPFEELGNIEASEDLFATDPGIAFRHNGTGWEETAAFDWCHGGGKRSPKLLIKRGDLAICIAYQFPGDKGRRHCIFGSADGGQNWQAIWMGDDIGCATEHVSGQSDEDAVSVFFTSGGRHYILTFKKKA